MLSLVPDVDVKKPMLFYIAELELPYHTSYILKLKQLLCMHLQSCESEQIYKEASFKLVLHS